LFQNLNKLGEDLILGLMAKYRADTSAQKVDLGVGVFRDGSGDTPVLKAVRQAEAAILSAQTTKTYVSPAGRVEFNAAVIRLVLGASRREPKESRVRAIQAPGGCGALRLGAELIRAATPSAKVYVSTPTWANHIPLLGGCGLRLERYPYFDPASRGLVFDRMIESLEKAAPGDVVLLHACCHNPTGADLSLDQWRLVLDLLIRRRLVPFLDLAYQGFGADLDADVAGLRLVVESVPEALIAVSFSKNMGLYRERVGVLIAVSEESSGADAAYSHLLQIARSIYSMPPDHGAAIAAHILADPKLCNEWTAELGAMRARIENMRALLATNLCAATGGNAFDRIRTQRGMFSLLGVSQAAVERLCREYHIYMTADSRMNLAGIMPHNVEYVAQAVAAVVKP
jgi:aspartate aminotransferase